MRRTLARLTYLADVAVLAVRYYMSATSGSFWDWCFLDLQRKVEKTGRCNKHQLYFLAADAIDQRAIASAEKLMYYFHQEIERSLSTAFQLRLSNFLLGREQAA